MQWADATPAAYPGARLYYVRVLQLLRHAADSQRIWPSVCKLDPEHILALPSSRFFTDAMPASANHFRAGQFGHGCKRGTDEYVLLGGPDKKSFLLILQATHAIHPDCSSGYTMSFMICSSRFLYRLSSQARHTSTTCTRAE